MSHLLTLNNIHYDWFFHTRIVGQLILSALGVHGKQHLWATSQLWLETIKKSIYHV